MPHSLDHPSSRPLLGEVRSLFQKRRIFFSLRTHIAFVCGGNKKKDLRPRFIQFVGNSKSKLAIFRAEDALVDLFSHRDPDFINLGKLEKLIANVFDSIVIFPESPGSYAELGYFAHDRQIRKRTLIVNSDTYQSDSFLTLGPIAAVDQDSIFRSTILLRKDSNKPRFDLVINRLMRITSKRQHREPFRYKPYKAMSPKDRFLVIAEIVNIFGAIDLLDLEICIKTAFGTAHRSELRELVSILCAAQLVARDRHDPDYFVPTQRSKRFLEYEHFDIESLQAKIAQHYKKYDPDRFSILGRIQ
ncbi:MAG: hypothetical protein HYY78_19390 [Betaproteobacteria bacterium]|nr:hypothetical protein [Betaproteobacteria bacterium]